MNRFIFLRMALQNIRRGRRFYLPYILTLIGTSAGFYIVRALTLDPGVSQMRGGEEYVRMMLAMGSTVVAFFSAIFLFYSNSFLIKRRRKELGLYSVLGMGKRHIALMLAIETVIIAVSGIALGVASGMCYASYTVFAHYGLAHYESYTMIYWTFLVAGLGSVFFADFSALPAVFQQSKGIIGTLGVVIVATVLPYIFYTRGLEGVESGKASIITNIEPVVETLVGILVFHEALTVWTVLGVGCVFGCVILLAKGDKPCKESKSSTAST